MKKLSFFGYLSKNPGVLVWSLIIVLGFVYVATDKELTEGGKTIGYILFTSFLFTGVISAVRDFIKKRDDGFD